MVQFRKSKKFGPVRLTASKKGLGISAGGGPFRVSRGADGKTRRTVRVPGTGIYDTKVVGGKGKKRPPKGRAAARPSQDTATVHTPAAAQATPRKPWYKRRWVWVLGAFMLIVALFGGDDDDAETVEPEAPPSAAASDEPTTAADASPAPAEASPTSSEPEAEAWTAPEDGTWEYGDVSFGEWSDATGVREYAYMIDSPPTFTVEGDRVTVSSQINVRRVEDRGWGEPLSEDVTVYFSSGGHQKESSHINEAYGEADVECENDQLAGGETTTCKVTFTPRYPDEIQDFYWSVDRESVGTWPSQVSSD